MLDSFPTHVMKVTTEPPVLSPNDSPPPMAPTQEESVFRAQIQVLWALEVPIKSILHTDPYWTGGNAAFMDMSTIRPY